MQRAGVGSGDFSPDTQHLARRRLIGAAAAAAVAGGVRHGSGLTGLGSVLAVPKSQSNKAKQAIAKAQRYRRHRRIFLPLVGVETMGRYTLSRAASCLVLPNAQLQTGGMRQTCTPPQPSKEES